MGGELGGDLGLGSREAVIGGELLFRAEVMKAMESSLGEFLVC